MDGPGDVDFAGEWFGFTGKDDMVMYGSSYPHWQANELTGARRVSRPNSATSCAGATPRSSTG